MIISAITMGYAFPHGDFDARVHSAFHSALNLRWNGAPGLLTLIASGEGDLPQGVRVNTPDGFSFERFQTGERAVCRDGILHFETSSLTVHLNGARSWECDLPALKFDPTNPDSSTAWTQVWELLNKRQRLFESDIIAQELFHSNTSQVGTHRRAGEAMRDLFDATRRYDLTDISAIQSLIGLGAGLTPSGDDLLVGYMTGLWCVVRDFDERAQFISNLGKAIIELLYKTNDISRTYLYHAAQGQVSSRLADLAEAICRGRAARQLHETAETAMSLGHTSGMDVVTGLLVGLTAWEGSHLFSV